MKKTNIAKRTKQPPVTKRTEREDAEPLSGPRPAPALVSLPTKRKRRSIAVHTKLSRAYCEAEVQLLGVRAPFVEAPSNLPLAELLRDKLGRCLTTVDEGNPISKGVLKTIADVLGCMRGAFKDPEGLDGCDLPSALCGLQDLAALAIELDNRLRIARYVAEEDLQLIVESPDETRGAA